MQGDIINDGTIVVEAWSNARTYELSSRGFADANAYGMEIDYPLLGDIINDGTIEAWSNAQAYGSSSRANAYAYGIEVYDLQGDIINDGTIEAWSSAQAYGSDASVDAYAYGISVSDSMTGTIDNTGSIIATADAYASSDSFSSANADAEAYGISFEDYLTGDINNSGLVQAEAIAEAYGSYASADAYAYGIYTYDDHIGTISNDGTIEAYAEAQANATSSDYPYAYAYGVYIDGTEGDMLNDGTIRAEAYSNAEGYASADAKGIYIDSIVGDVLNSQTIEALAEASASGEESDAYAHAYGISVASMEGDILNAGSIAAQAQSFASDENYAYAYGINAFGGPLSIYGDIFNSGTIQATALSDGEGEIEAYGIYAFGAGTVQNDETGLISVVSDGLGFGMYVDDANTDLNNYGTIIVDAEDGAGLVVGSGDWEVFNPGFIYTSGNVRTLAVGSYDHLWIGAEPIGPAYAQAMLVDDFRIIFDGDPYLEPEEEGTYVPQILVGNDGYLDLNGQTLIAQAGKNIAWNTPYQVIETYNFYEERTHRERVRRSGQPQPEHQRVSWVDSDETGEGAEVIFGYDPKGSAPGAGMRLANLGAIQNSNLIQQRSFSQLLAKHIKTQQDTLLADSGTTASDAGFLVARSGDNLENAMFIRPYAKAIDRSTSGGMGYDGNIYGFVLGYERSLSPELTLGAHAGIGFGTLDFKGDGYSDNDEDQTIYSLGVHAAYNPDAWHFDGSATFYVAEHEYDGKTGNFLEIDESDDYTSYGAEVEVIGGYVIPSGDWAVMPYAGLGYSWINADSHTTDADDPAWDTKYGSVDEHIVRSILGAQLSGNLMWGETRVVPSLGARWEYALTDNNITVKQSTLGSPNVAVKTTSPDPRSSARHPSASPREHSTANWAARRNTTTITTHTAVG
jgi:hypothetical protein